MALKKFIALLLLLALQICLASATFNYTDQTNWGSSCNNLGYQSPIDIPCEQFLTVCPPAKSYQIYWKEPMMQFGASPFEDLKTFFTNNSWVRFSNETNDYIFKSWQFHLHQNSEHTVNGRSYPLEMHVVHKLDHPTIV
jgi:carbonic anhydrase